MSLSNVAVNVADAPGDSELRAGRGDTHRHAFDLILHHSRLVPGTLQGSRVDAREASQAFMTGPNQPLGAQR